MTPDEAIEKARWYAREDIATTLREEANVLADEVERLRERVARLEEALRPFVENADDEAVFDMLVSAGLDVAVIEARAALEGK